MVPYAVPYRSAAEDSRARGAVTDGWVRSPIGKGFSPEMDSPNREIPDHERKGRRRCKEVPRESRRRSSRGRYKISQARMTTKWFFCGQKRTNATLSLCPLGRTLGHTGIPRLQPLRMAVTSLNYSSVVRPNTVTPFRLRSGPIRVISACDCLFQSTVDWHRKPRGKGSVSTSGL